LVTGCWQIFAGKKSLFSEQVKELKAIGLDKGIQASR
jgi:hypothetical protein